MHNKKKEFFFGKTTKIGYHRRVNGELTMLFYQYNLKLKMLLVFTFFVIK